MRDSAKAWAVLGVGIICYEAVAPEGELLSECVDDWLVHHPVLTRVGVMAVALHLINVFDQAGLKRYDPVSVLGVGAHTAVLWLYHSSKGTVSRRKACQ